VIGAKFGGWGTILNKIAKIHSVNTNNSFFILISITYLFFLPLRLLYIP
jgi:hypothetical protein